MTRAVSKPKSSPTLEMAVRVVFLALLVLIALVVPSSFVLIFFVPVVVWYIWKLRDKTTKLEQRIAALEKPSEVKSEES